MPADPAKGNGALLVDVPNRDDYVNRIRTAARTLQKEGFLLPQDTAVIVAAAAAHPWAKEWLRRNSVSFVTFRRRTLALSPHLIDPRAHETGYPRTDRKHLLAGPGARFHGRTVQLPAEPARRRDALTTSTGP